MKNVATRTRPGAPARRAALPLLSLVLLFSLLLAACGPTQDVVPTPTAGPETPTPIPIAAATDTAAPASTASAADTATPGGQAGAGTPTVAGTPAAAGTVAATTKKITVGILQTATHPALDFTRAGVQQAFAQAGFVEGQTITYDIQNEEGDAVNAARMADGFINKKVDAIITIGTPATQAALAEAKKQNSTIPIFFAAVADPYGPGFAGKTEGATITADPKIHPDFLTGVAAFPPVEDGLKLIKEVNPNAKNIGLLWNPSEPNSVATTNKAREVAASLGLTLIDRTATKPADTLAAAQALSGYGIDAFFVSTTNSVVAGLDSVVRVAQESKIPLFGNDPLSASRGAIAADGLDYTENGLEAGQMAVSVLTNKATVKSLPVQSTTKQALCINTKAASLQSVTLPGSLTDRAKGCTYTEIKAAVAPTAGPATTPTKAP